MISDMRHRRKNTKGKERAELLHDIMDEKDYR